MLLNVKLYNVMHSNCKDLARIYVLRKANILYRKIGWFHQKNVFIDFCSFYNMDFFI